MVTREKGKRLTAYVQDYVVFDLETTGLNPATDEIIEISGIRVRERSIEDTFSTLVNPGMPIPYSATRVNGITDTMVKDAPVLEKALADFLDFIGGDILVGHNIHTFDMNFVYDSAMRRLGKQVANDYVDTLYLAKSCLPQLRHHRLTDIAEYFDITTEGAHRALNDCIMNQQCYERLGEIWSRQTAVKGTREEKSGFKPGEMVCPECGCLMVKRKGRFGEFFGCTGYPLCRNTQKA